MTPRQITLAVGVALVPLFPSPLLAGGVPPDAAAALALPSLARSPGRFPAAVGLPNAIPVPGYGIGYNLGAYPPPSQIVGPYQRVFQDEQDDLPPVTVDNGPEEHPSAMSIYAAGSENGLSCSWHHTWSVAQGRRWERLCY